MAVQDLAQLKASANWHDPVVVIGASPVGLIAALGLAHYQVPSIVLEEGPGPAVEDLRVSVLEQSALEILRAWSTIGQHIVRNGIAPSGERVLFRRTQLYRRQIVQAPDAGYPLYVNIHQGTLEYLLLQMLQATGCCQVFWQQRVTGMAQDGEGVNLELSTPRGRWYFRAPYVLAADGPHSVLHGLLGVTFSGEPRDYHFLNLDVRMQLDAPHERWFWFDPPFNPGYIAQLHPLPGGIYRLVYQLSPREDQVALRSPEAVQRRVVATVGKRPYEILSMEVSSYRQAVLDRFSYGRIFFLGNAAHLASPFDNGELVSGIEDAWNLLWKLVLVRAGLAMVSLLDTYHDERHAAAVEMLRRSNEALSFLLPSPGLAHWRRNTTLRLSQPFKFMRGYIDMGSRSGSVAYETSAIFSEDHRLYLGGRFTKLRGEQNAVLKRFRKGPLVGTQAPSLVLPDADTGRAVSLFEQLGQSFMALCFSTDADMAMAVLQHVRENLPGIPIAFYLVSPAAPAFPAGEGVIALVDAEGQAAKAYNAGPRSLYLVRPDGYIAARRFDSDFNDIPALLRHAMGEDVVDTQTRMRRAAEWAESSS